MSPAKRFALRIAAIAAGIALACLLVEGAASLFFGRSLLRRQSETAPLRLRMLEEERLRAGALTEGPYAVDTDPRVGIRIKGNHAGKFFDEVANTDKIGMRKRVGRGGAQADGKRIVILGDSVAFGFGLRDDETFAEQVEGFLAPLAPAGRPGPVGLTVACPGWSFQNASRFLLDHLDEIRPALVIYLPSDNDLDDSASALETGHRSMDFDPAKGAAAAPCSLSYYHFMLSARRSLFPDHSDADARYVVYSGITRESARRYRAMIAGLADLERRLAGADCRFAIARLVDSPMLDRMARFPEAGKLTIPSFSIFDLAKPEDTLPGDPHPNARCVKAAAWRIARFLIERGWVESTGRLPAEDSAYAGRKSETLGEDAARRADDLAAQGILGSVDFTNGAGWPQVYSGIWPDGMIGQPGMLALRTKSKTAITVRISRLAGRPGLLPLALEVSADDVRLGSIEAQPIAPGEDPAIAARYPIPEALRGADFVDVRLIPSNWVYELEHGISRLASCKVLSVGAE